MNDGLTAKPRHASQAEAKPNASLVALCAIAILHHIPATLGHQFGLAPRDIVSIPDLLRAAKQLGLKAKRSCTTPKRLPLSPLPALALLKGRVIILAQRDGKRVLFQDPSSGTASPTIESLEVFQTRWSGEFILLISRASLAGTLAQFDFSWFVPALVKYRRLLGEVLLISFLLQLVGLISPLFFQVAMDKVLVHKGMTTLDVLVSGDDTHRAGAIA